MKDTIVTVKRKKTELLTFTLCFLIANVLNLYAIIAYEGSHLELLTSLGYVTLTACGLYLIWSLLRIIFYTVTSLLKRKR